MENKQSYILKFFDKSAQLHITYTAYKRCVHALFSWLLVQDNVSHDATTTLLFSDIVTKDVTAQLVTRQNIIIAGVEEIIYLIKTFTTLQYTVIKKDGDYLNAGEVLMKLHGKPEEILTYERTILNIFQRLCAIATQTNDGVAYIHSLGLAKEPYIAATRKTVWSYLDKKAVAVGGGITHRLTLADGILVKDNHLLLLEKTYNLDTEEEAVRKTIELGIHGVTDTLIEIEVEKKESITSLIDQFYTVTTGNVLGILLDNFTPTLAKQAITDLQKRDLSTIVFEASGGITSENLSTWAETGVDIISLGALTHSVKAVDISLEII